MLLEWEEGSTPDMNADITLRFEVINRSKRTLIQAIEVIFRANGKTKPLMKIRCSTGFLRLLNRIYCLRLKIFPISYTLFYHAMTGCDTSSSMLGNEKKLAFNILKYKEGLRKEVNVFISRKANKRREIYDKPVQRWIFIIRWAPCFGGSTKNDWTAF